MTEANGIEPPVPRNVRLAGVADAEQIAELQYSIMSQVLAGVGVPVDFTEAGIEQAWSHTIGLPEQKGQAVLRAIEGETFCGFAAFASVSVPLEQRNRVNESKLPSVKRHPEDRAAEIVALEIVPTLRGRGHASRLLSAIADLAKQSKLARLQVWIMADDQAKIGFFRRVGFAPAGMRRMLPVADRQITEHLWYSILGPTDNES